MAARFPAAQPTERTGAQQRDLHPSVVPSLPNSTSRGGRETGANGQVKGGGKAGGTGTVRGGGRGGGEGGRRREGGRKEEEEEAPPEDESSTIVPSDRRGLSSLVAKYLGKPLDKSQQLSDWERRPLRVDQIRYAGTQIALPVRFNGAVS